MNEQRRSGVALWRQIADQLRDELTGFAEREGGRLPPEVELSERFGVNRHTIRAALSALADEDLISSVRGRGTFVRSTPRISYPLSRRTRFSAALEAQNSSGHTRLLSHDQISADATVAEILELDVGAAVLKLDTLGIADGHALSLASHWFDARRFAALADHLAQTQSITLALKACGVEDYLRRSTVLHARLATSEEIRRLSLGDNPIVLVSRAVNTDITGAVIQFTDSRFAANRVEMTIAGT